MNVPVNGPVSLADDGDLCVAAATFLRALQVGTRATQKLGCALEVVGSGWVVLVGACCLQAIRLNVLLLMYRRRGTLRGGRQLKLSVMSV